MLVAPTELQHPPFKALTRAGRGSNLPEQHGCDFLFYARGRAFGVQRKELADFIASAQDGRLGAETAQMQGLEQALLVIEGTPRWSLDGELLIAGHTQRWTRAAHLGLLWSLQARGWWWCATKDIPETAWACEAFEAWAKKEKHRALDHRPGPSNSYGRATNRDFQRHLWQSVQGIGPELADRLIDTVGLPFKLTVDDGELLAVEGVGDKTLKKIKEAFGG